MTVTCVIAAARGVECMSRACACVRARKRHEGIPNFGRMFTLAPLGKEPEIGLQLRNHSIRRACPEIGGSRAQPSYGGGESGTR